MTGRDGQSLGVVTMAVIAGSMLQAHLLAHEGGYVTGLDQVQVCHVTALCLKQLVERST